MTTAKTADGDVTAIFQDAIFRKQSKSRATAIAFILFYIVHIAVYIKLRLKEEHKLKCWLEVRKQAFMQLLAFGTIYYANKEISGLFVLLVWIVALSAVAANLLCIWEIKREEMMMKVAITVSYACVLLFWVFYFVQLRSKY